MMEESKTDKPDGEKVEIYKECCAEIDLYERSMKKYDERCDKIMKLFSAQKSVDDGKGKQPRFNMLWSNQNIIGPSTYSSTPKPVVKRRFNDKDEVGRVGSEILERSIDYQLDSDCFEEAMKAVRLDFGLLARGVPWVRYRSVGTSGKPLMISNEADDVEEDVAYQEVYVEHIHRKDFGHSIARKWSQVNKVWRKVYMTREELVERFGDIGKEMKLDAIPEEIKEQLVGGETEKYFKKARVYEVWDKQRKQVVWMTKGAGMHEPLDVQPDFLKLKKFFPCPKPAYGTLTNDSLEPIPDYVMTQDVSKTLDILLGRIQSISDSIVSKGAYAGDNPDIAKILKARDGTMIGVKEWTQLLQSGGIDSLLWMFPIEPLIQALAATQNGFEFMKGVAYEVGGNSDILRGTTDPNETYGAQKIKATFASKRLKEKQDEMTRMVRDVVALVGEIVAEQFEPETLGLMAGVDRMDEGERGLAVQALMMIREEKARDFRIDIETDSSIAIDEDKDKADVNELLQVVGSFFKNAMPVAQDMPAMAPALIEMILFVMRRYKVGRTMEDNLEKALQESLQAQQQKQGAPDPKAQEAQAKAMVDMRKLEMEQQKLQAKLAEVQQRAEEARLEAQSKIAAAEMKFREGIAKQQNEREIAEMKAVQDAADRYADRQLKSTELAINAQRTYGPSA